MELLLVVVLFIAVCDATIPITHSISLRQDHQQYTKIDNLYLDSQNKFILNQQSLIEPNYVKLHDNVFFIKNLSEDRDITINDVNIISDIALIFLEDHLMCHLFHIMEHIIAQMTVLMELHLSECQHSNKNQFSNVKYAIFPNLDGIMCLGKYDVNQKLLKLLFPNINIICGHDIFQQFKSNKLIMFETSIISMRILEFEKLDIDCSKSESCLWNKMNGAYLDIIKLHNQYFTRFLWYQLREHLNINNVIFERGLNMHKIGFISRESTSNRKMIDSVRIEFLNKLNNHKYFGDKHKFEILELKMEEYELYEQMRIISECSIIIGVHGNGLTHIAWFGDDYYGIQQHRKLVIELLPPTQLRINDYMVQAAFTNSIHFQWDTESGQIRSASYSFDKCSAEYYRPNNNPNALIKTFKNMDKLFDSMYDVWMMNDKDSAINILENIDLDGNEKICIKSWDKSQNNDKNSLFQSVKSVSNEYSNGVCHK